jgi:branched-chain amino acid transport system permease protein
MSLRRAKTKSFGDVPEPGSAAPTLIVGKDSGYVSASSQAAVADAVATVPVNGFAAMPIAQLGARLKSSWERLPEVVRWLAIGLAALGIGAIPLVLDNLYFRDIFTFVALYSILGLGLNIVVGYAGLLDLGYIAFYAIGAYTIAWFTAQAHLLPFWAAFPLAVGGGALFGILLGAPTLRLRPDYLAMVTMGFGEIVRITINNLDPITNGPRGIAGIPRPDLGFFKITNPNQLHFLIIGVAVGVAFIAVRLADSRIGRGWTYTREDEVAAEATGVNTVRMKLLAFALGAAFAGVAGGFFSTKMLMVAPESFTWWESLSVLIIVALGGMGSIPGVIIGAVVVVALPEVLRGFSDYRMLVLGVVLILMALFRPKGIWPATPYRVRAVPILLGGGGGRTGGLSVATSPFPPAATAATNRASDILLTARGVTMRFGGVSALTDVSLQIRRGEIVSLIGPNGAGKTTFLNVMAGVYSPTSGSIAFDGKPLTRLRPNAVATVGIARTFQNIRLFPELTVIENAAAGLHCRTKAGSIEAILHTGSERAEEQAIWRQSLRILEFVGLDQRAGEIAKNLPYGSQRRLEIARALATSPKLLVLDEPAAGMTPGEAAELIVLIKSIRQSGVTVLLIEHHMDVVMAISDRVIVLNYGQIIAQGTPDEVQENPAVIEAYLGREDEDD